MNKILNISRLNWSIGLLVVAFSFILSCGVNQKPGLDTEKPQIVTFADSITASKEIIESDVDGFFDGISSVDMKIQMKDTTLISNRSKLLKEYKMFLSAQVSDWNTEEKEFLLKVFGKVKSLCDNISPRIFPGGIKLIKIKTGHYGKDVYYTRGMNILIPENIFVPAIEERQLPVMIHEVFHIISRYQPDLKTTLYNLIGFVKSDKPIKLNSHLRDYLLTNPDGVSYQHYINIGSESQVVKAIPVITSKYRNYRESTPSFFDYLHFDLYKLEDKGSFYEAQTDASGQSTVPLKSTPSFFTKIRDNTQYIIHPDEIMADNFMLALLAYEKNDYSKFSKEGKQLIDQIVAVLKLR